MKCKYIKFSAGGPSRIRGKTKINDYRRFSKRFTSWQSTVQLLLNALAVCAYV